ncbi:MAG: hypothetical protein R3E33_00500 [Rhodocyclaceae bacterium]
MTTKRSGIGPFLFDEWRYLGCGEPGQVCSARQGESRLLLEPRACSLDA